MRSSVLSHSAPCPSARLCAQVAGDNFVGLPCDEDNEPDQSEDRVKAWVAQIKGEGMPL